MTARVPKSLQLFLRHMELISLLRRPIDRFHLFDGRHFINIKSFNFFIVHYSHPLPAQV